MVQEIPSILDNYWTTKVDHQSTRMPYSFHDPSLGSFHHILRINQFVNGHSPEALDAQWLVQLHVRDTDRELRNLRVLTLLEDRSGPLQHL